MSFTGGIVLSASSMNCWVVRWDFPRGHAAPRPVKYSTRPHRPVSDMVGPLNFFGRTGLENGPASFSYHLVGYAQDFSSSTLLKSTGFLHPGHLCGLSNSSEKISITLPHSGQSNVTDVSDLCASKPGQCISVVMTDSSSDNVWCSSRTNGFRPSVKTIIQRDPASNP